MGIPRLTSYLSPYVVTTVLGCDKPACKKHSSSVNDRSNQVIIDGPAFAYLIYDRLVAHKSDHLDVLAAVPSYDEVGNAALAFLSHLEECGVITENIYFDGFLPPQKTKTRTERLEKQVERLSTFRSLHQLGFHDIAPAPGAHAVSISCILNPTRTKTTLQGLPAASFFVAAVLEAIKNSKYASITEVVPGEADTYCAATARQSGGSILSNDSDLLIYDLGPDGAVGSLNNLEVVAHDVRNDVGAKETCHVVQTTVIKPRDVARLLGLEDLQNLAYVLKTESDISFQTAIRQAQRTRLSGNHFQQTLGEYVIEPAAFESCMFRKGILARIRTLSPFLDPRISEFILQSDQQCASIYLPIMIEDPSQTPAFAASISQRTFAYSCCTLPYQVQNREVLEYGRKGMKIVPISIKSLSGVEILAHANILRTRLQHFKTTFSISPTAIIWRTYALAEVYHWYLDTARTPPSRDSVITVITGQVKGRVTWDDIHLCARIEASLYSLRIVQQVLKFVLPFDPKDETEMSMMEILMGLKEDLEDLPPLKQLMPSRLEMLAQTVDLDVDELLNSLASILQDDVVQEALVYSTDDKNDEGADTRKRTRKQVRKAL